MIKCNSFVFLDLESTGLPGKEDDGGRTKITEICFISISRETTSEVHHDDLPRNLHKLTIPVNPGKLISKIATDLSGLDNAMLENEELFNEKKAALIKRFLEQCQQPICFIAHNGYKFDFPLLREELIPFPDVIPENTRCIDSLYAFRDLFHLRDVDEKLRFNPFINGVDLELVKAAEAVERQSKSLAKVDMALMQMLNETTPQSQKIPCSSTAGTSSSVSVHLKRKLFDDELNNGDANTSRTQMKSFCLDKVYLQIFGTPMVSHHRAEDDTAALMKCCLRFGQRIVDYFDRNSRPYFHVEPMFLK